MSLRKMVLGMVVVLASALAPAGATEPIKSGPQAGEKVPGPFLPLNVNGAYAGQHHCLYCENGARPAVMVFARDPNMATLLLIKKLDDAAAHANRPMGAYVIFCTDDDTLAGRLQKWCKAAAIGKAVIAVYPSEGPKEYHIAKDADVTALVYKERKVTANHSFRKGEMNEQGVNAILGDLPKILTQD